MASDGGAPGGLRTAGARSAVRSPHSGRTGQGPVTQVRSDSALPALVLRAWARRARPAAEDCPTGHLLGEDGRAAGGNQARGSVAPGGLSSRGSTGSGPSMRSASSSDSTLKGRGPGPGRPRPHVLSPGGFMPSDAGAMCRRWGGAQLSCLGLAAPPPSAPDKKAAPLSYAAVQSLRPLPRVPRRPLASLTPGGGTGGQGQVRNPGPVRPRPGPVWHVSVPLARPAVLLPWKRRGHLGSTRSWPQPPHLEEPTGRGVAGLRSEHRQ